MSNANISGIEHDHLALDMVLPWHEHAEQQEKFKRLIKKIIIPFMVFLLLMPFLPDLTPQQALIKKVVTKVILDPPKVVQVPEPTAPQAKQPARKIKRAKAEAPPKVGTKEGLTNLATLSQKLNAMRNSVNISKLQKKNVFVSNSGKVKKSSRALLGKHNATTASGGLKASDITVNAKGAAMMDHQSSAIESPNMAVSLPSETQFYQPIKQTRSGQSIRRTVERAKGSLFAIYNKALRLNPNLAGRFVFSFKVAPSGEISLVKLISSDLDDKKLERALLSKIQRIQFEKEDVDMGSFEYTFDFLPS